MFCQAEILRERNELAAAQALVTEAISLCEQSIALHRSGFYSGVCRTDTYLPLTQRFGCAHALSSNKYSRLAH